uniref:Secreted protein n=1 Tax=Rhipicephalus appendiculatus TaxID=34631 RepID=A0A131YA98_RHIAP
MVDMNFMILFISTVLLANTWYVVCVEVVFHCNAGLNFREGFIACARNFCLIPIVIVKQCLKMHSVLSFRAPTSVVKNVQDA